MERMGMSDAVDDLPSAPIGWAIVELLGHRRLAGHVSTEDVAGAPFLRVATPAEGDAYTITLIPPASVYAITPATEGTARRAAASASFRPAPVSPYEVGTKAIEPDQVADWLGDAEFDRLRWAVARIRNRREGPTTEDEAEADALVRAIRTIDLPF